MARTGTDSGGGGVAVSFDAVSEGISVFDPIERHSCTLGTPGSVRPEPADADAFSVPVDDAVSVHTSAVTLPNLLATCVRDRNGDPIAQAEHESEFTLPPGEYTVELTTPVKTYLHVESALTVGAADGGRRVDFGAETEVLVGARSRHQRPAATVTTTDDPHDLMRAVSTLGSALKTTSPERAYPTLRGHPPLIERGEELHVPAGIERPDTGVRIELPPELQYVYPAASLAYYLGAEVVPGSEPRIATDGFEYALEGPPGYETRVARALKQCFLLDCVVRTEGLYTVDLHERGAVETAAGIDPAALYRASPAERLEAYLSVPWEAVSEHVPEWKLTTHLETDPGNVELLPFLVDDLAVVRSPQRGPAAPTSKASAQRAALDEFLRDGSFTRSAGAVESETPETVDPAETDSLESAWAGEGVPAGASKPTVSAFRNRLEREPAEGDVGIALVCNDAAMDDERDAVESVYGAREELPLSVNVHRNLTTDELREVLAGSQDFLHYIGHIDERGFECADGVLDAHSLTEVGVDAFLLNACQSYDQGTALIDAGAIGGVVTLEEVVNEGAVEVGCTLARLLNRGFPLRAALDLAGDESVIGHQYAVLGDGGLSIAQAESGTPYICEIDESGEEFSLSIKTYPTSDRGLGSVFMPFLEDNDTYYLSSGSLEEFDLSRAELAEFLHKENAPVLVDGEFKWAYDLKLPV
jgi:hypothetical protein